MTKSQSLTGELESEGSPLSVEIVDAARNLAKHPLYSALQSLQDVQIYMSYQVWCVWDFMSLAKAIQLGVTCMTVPWIPSNDAEAVAYINEIIASEEADVSVDGRRASHFETYLRAMKEAGVSTNAIDSYIESLRKGDDYMQALEKCGAPEAAQEFVKTTLNFATGPLHKAIAAFCLGREEIIPQMFIYLLSDKSTKGVSQAVLSDSKLTIFRWYLERHIKLDIESHGPLSVHLFHSIIKNDPNKREEALQAGLHSLEARKKLLDAILSHIIQHR